MIKPEATWVPKSSFGRQLATLSTTLATFACLSGAVLSADLAPADVAPTVLRMALIPAYRPCSKPNAVTNATAGVPLPTCLPARVVDAQCTLGSAGSGAFTATALQSDVKIEGRITGLVGCDGAELTFTVTSRSTVNYCATAGLCTTIDVRDFPVAKCTVDRGSCMVETTVNSYTRKAEGFLVFEQGTSTEIAFLGCGVKRDDVYVLECGLKVK